MEDAKKQPSKQRRDDRRPGGGRGHGRRKEQEPREFDQKILDLSRVTRVTAGGKRMSFRATLVIGDRKGRVGMGIAKGADVAIAVEKAFRQAKKKMLTIPMVHKTIPHEVSQSFGAADILLKPAPQGTGLKSGGAIRVILELGGLPNVVSKNLGSDNKINIAKATFVALKKLRVPEGVELDSEKKSAPAKSTARPDRANGDKFDKKGKKPAAKNPAANKQAEPTEKSAETK